MKSLREVCNSIKTFDYKHNFYIHVHDPSAYKDIALILNTFEDAICHIGNDIKITRNKNQFEIKLNAKTVSMENESSVVIEKTKTLYFEEEKRNEKIY